MAKEDIRSILHSLHRHTSKPQKNCKMLFHHHRQWYQQTSEKNNYIFIQFDAKMTKKSKNQKKIVKSELDEISFNMNKIQFYSFLIRSSNRKGQVYSFLTLTLPLLKMLKKIPMKTILMTSLILLNSINTERVKEEKNRTISASCQEPEAEGKIYKLAACYRARTSFPTSKLQFFKY